jgi:hypothetical protein
LHALRFGLGFALGFLLALTFGSGGCSFLRLYTLTLDALAFGLLGGLAVNASCLAFSSAWRSRSTRSCSAFSAAWRSRSSRRSSLAALISRAF